MHEAQTFFFIYPAGFKNGLFLSYAIPACFVSGNFVPSFFHKHTSHSLVGAVSTVEIFVFQHIFPPVPCKDNKAFFLQPFWNIQLLKTNKHAAVFEFKNQKNWIGTPVCPHSSASHPETADGIVFVMTHMMLASLIKTCFCDCFYLCWEVRLWPVS